MTDRGYPLFAWIIEEPEEGRWVPSRHWFYAPIFPTRAKARAMQKNLCRASRIRRCVVKPAFGSAP